MKTTHTIYMSFARRALKEIITIICLLFILGIKSAWGASFSTSYGYSDMGTSAGKTWNLTDYEDKTSYWRCPASGNTSVATIPDVFKGKYITSAVTITINHATYGSGTNPSEPTFQIYTSSCGVRIPAAQSGAFATDKDTYKDVVYTISAAETAYLGNDLNILITKPGKTIRLKSITVAYTYSDASTYTITWSNNGSTYTTTSVTQGRKVTFPAAPSSCDGTSTTFYGWSTAEWSGKLDDISSKTVYTSPETMPVPTANTTYYAVFGLPGSETTATFTASDISATPATSNTLEWKHTATGALLHLSGGQRYTGSPNTFSVAPGSTNYAVVSGVYMTKVVAACTSTTYRLTASSAGTFSNPSSSNYQAAGINGFEVKLYAGNGANQARITTLTVYYKPFSALLTNCASCGSDPTVTAASSNGSVSSTSIPVQCASGISNIGGAGCSLTDYGFVWKTTSAAPDISTDTKHSLGSSIAASTTFNYTITGLSPNTPYYIYAYATNGHGTGYSSVYNPTTLQRYAISYNANGGSGSMDGAYKDHGVTFALPATAGSMTKTGYHATGWLLGSSSGTHYDLSGSYTTNAAATFYVEWTANTYQVAFDKNGGTGSMSNETGFTYGESKALTACSFTAPAHKYFIGWNTDKDATTALYTDGQSVSNLTTTHNGTVTLYAIWKDHTFTNYRTVCCTEMGTINNSLSLTQGGNSVTISGWTYNDASSTKPAESNLASYTVRMYKKNGASWDLVSGTATGGSAGTAGTRTGIATNSKSVTFTGLVVESEYKFTIEGIGAAGYCDIEETEITSINSTDVSSTPFKFRYSIYIDDGSGDNWAHNYITPTGNTDEGSVSITLGAHVTSYQFKIFGGFAGDWGQTGSDGVIPASTKWTLNGSYNVKLNTGAGGAYVFTVDYSGTTNPGVTVTFPSADQDADYKIYFDKSAVADWGATLKYRIGNGSHNQNQNFTLVPGTDQFYVTTTPEYGSMDAWQIANNVAWSGSNSIYNYYHGDGNDITRATVYQDYAVDEDITIVPTSVHNTENSCQFWDVSKTSGMLTHTATITTPSHGTINIAYTDVSGTSQPTNTSTVADLAHRTILTITATPATGYTCTSLTVNGAAFTSGSTHILAADATIAATFTAQTSTVTLDNNDATSGSQQTVTATYDAAMPLVTTADGTPAVAAISRTGYTFNGWWDATSGGNQYYTYSGSPKVIASARTWDKTGAQTLKAQWTVNQYTLTWDLQGGTVATAGTGAAAAATGTPSSDQDYGTALTAPVVTKTGYDFNVWSPSVAGTMPAANTTYTASWTAQVYNITYKDQGDNAYSGNVTAGVPTGAPTTHTYGSATALVNGVKDGYRFDGWFTDASCTVSAGSSIGATAKTADFTLYAKWTQVYTVTWSVNGDTWETGVVDGNTYVPSGSKVSALPTAPTSSDCDDSKVFVGWRATAIDGVSVSAPSGIFTTQAGSPEITGTTTFYAVFADASPRQVISLTFPDDNSDNNGLTSNQYTSEWTAKAGTFSFTINNFNNNNWGGSWTYIKCGRKDYASVAKITTDTDIDFRVDSVYVTLGNITGSKVNSAKLQISAASNFSSVTEMDIPKNSGTNKLKIASPATDKYYRIVYDCASNTSNGFVQINSVEFIQQSEKSNYVTSCASCDEDATYTNTTPTVSDIDCTGATLTMEDGLATVGADGCHVSDYGFVIGTSDNPAVGGDGVTKLQVGTSDPTIGADFSYDATGLTKGTHYYIRAYATNRHGTAYSSSTNFWTKNVSSIAITTAPTKTNYIVGETFDATGMVVTATMADSNSEDVTSDVTYSSSALTAGTSQNFAINYTLCETEKSVNQVINVYTLTVTEGTNPSYGTATNSSANIVSITGLGDHKTYTVTVTSSNATAVDNGDNTWSIINPTGNVTVLVDYADAVQVKVYYKVDGVTVTGLTQDVYQSETTTLPSASDLATAMTAQGMEIPDDSYPNFVGWSETEFGAQTSEPTLVTGTPTINAEKTYYAVYTNLNKITIIPSDFSTSYPSSGSADGTKTFGGKRFGWNYLLNGNVSKTNLPLQFKKNSTEYGRLYNTDPLNYILRVEIGYYNADSHVPVYVASSAGMISGGALTPASRESTDPYVYTMPASTSYFYIKGDNSTVYKIRSVDIYYSPATVYYMTQFCTNRVTLTQNSPEHGTVEFGRSSLVTCGSDKEVSLTIIPDVGYQLTGWTVNTSSGYADAKTTSPAVVTNSNNSAAQNITLTFAEDANKDYDVTATFGLMTVTSWAWTVNSAAIPDPLNLYVGQSARLDVAYTPAGVDASKKTYGRTKEDAYINWVGGAYATYSTISGKASTGENTTPVTFTHGDGPTTTVNVKVLPLPAVHFGDIVHNVEFADVVATLSDNTLSPTKTTPTHADFEGSTANTCEEQHLHLVGWIREDWPALVTYLNGGAQPSTDDITGAGNDGSGNAYFFAPGASINTQTFNGVTFYAVWAKVE